MRSLKQYSICLSAPSASSPAKIGRAQVLCGEKIKNVEVVALKSAESKPLILVFFKTITRNRYFSAHVFDAFLSQREGGEIHA